MGLAFPSATNDARDSGRMTVFPSVHSPLT
nr:MAG TPA: hypothetical protein [Caudoviricetes sp.]